jgi:hypothetical protein
MDLMDSVLRHPLFRSWSTLSSPCSSVLECLPSSSKQNLRVPLPIGLTSLVNYLLFLYFFLYDRDPRLSSSCHDSRSR